MLVRVWIMRRQADEMELGCVVFVPNKVPLNLAHRRNKLTARTRETLHPKVLSPLQQHKM